MLHKTLLMVVLPAVNLLTDENVSADTPKSQEISLESPSTIIQIVKEQSDSIQHFDKERLYLKAERIFPTSHGLLLYNGHSSILLPAVLADETGCYLPCRRRHSDDELVCSNPDCGYRWSFSETWGIHCPVCGSIGN